MLSTKQMPHIGLSWKRFVNEGKRLGRFLEEWEEFCWGSLGRLSAC